MENDEGRKGVKKKKKESFREISTRFVNNTIPPFRLINH